ncbi:DNA-binding transcriptional regulator, GntR family [Roseomonas rosea]|uniref:DNA-binding transcriptional regulator, GntR family n=1 Tax=Muricoccus roseus TaxID=198092 RepID=A0A1M6PU23_9PROT|nr:GntR family transcriptional regulator [Roseomonas rosea]SHK11469.1 DNA-binding transcriptional regulator, GntR family [Roseomonas rosea]
MDRSRLRLADSVYERVKEMILDGRFGTETWIPIDILVSELAVSRQPVMDTMRRLSLEGFVSIVPQVGCRPRPYAAEDVQDFFVLFAEGEAQVAQIAAQRADARDLIELRLISQEIGALRKARLGDAERGRLYRDLNRRFHRSIRHASKSPVAAEIVEGMGDRSDFFVAQSGRFIFATRLKTAHDEHEALIAAIADRLPMRAAEVARAHILAIGERLRRVPAPAGVGGTKEAPGT